MCALTEIQQERRTRKRLSQDDSEVSGVPQVGSRRSLHTMSNAFYSTQLSSLLASAGRGE